jgi:hypothetical protein
MRTKAAARVVGVGVGLAIATTWSLEASAQLQPPTPLLPPPPGWNAQPTYAPAPQPSATQQQLNASDNASSFRRFELVYVTAEVGGAYVNVGDKFTNHASQGGVALGLGAGLRFLIFTLGIRGRVAPLSAYTLIEANAEAGVHIPLGAWDPYVNIHGGYAQAAMNSQPLAGSLPSGSVSFTPPSPSGGDFGGALGTDYYFTALFSLGIDASLDALFLSTNSTTLAGFPIPGASGTGVAFLASAHAGLHHFDL